MAPLVDHQMRTSSRGDQDQCASRGLLLSWESEQRCVGSAGLISRKWERGETPGVMLSSVPLSLYQPTPFLIMLLFLFLLTPPCFALSLRPILESGNFSLPIILSFDANCTVELGCGNYRSPPFV